MSEANIRAQIKTLIQGVTGIGIVHDYERWSRSLAEFLALMASSNKVNGWMIHRQQSTSDWQSNGEILVTHTYKISGIYELDDANASEGSFQILVDGIFTAFKSAITLNGQALRCHPIQIENVDVDEFGGRLFHSAQLSLSVEEIVMM
jgi:hypothetical protein